MGLGKEICDAAFTLYGWWLTFFIVVSVLVALIVICGYGVLFLWIAKTFGG
jgi:hypothetical protein